MRIRTLSLAVIILALMPIGFARAQHTTQTYCRMIPSVSSLPVGPKLKTIASCTLPCFNFDPGNQNTLITYEGSNEIAFTYLPSAPPTQIDVNLRVTCLGGNPPADIHTYTILNGGPQGSTITAIGAIDGGLRPNFNPLAPDNPWCDAPTNGCSIDLQMDAFTPGDAGIRVITNPPSVAHSDTGVLVKAIPLTN